MLYRTSLFAAVLLSGLASPAFAQAPASAPPTRVRGTVEIFQRHMLKVKTRGGETVVVTLAPNFAVRAVVAEKLADIKPGDKVGITSIEGGDHIRKAIEIHIFPASLSTVRMGELPWDLGTGSLMSNASVAEVSAAPANQTIKITVNGNQRAIVVPPGTPIVSYAPGNPELLKPGATVFLIARKGADGGLSAASVTAETNGVKPPM
jgi:hypothetical protein